MKLIFYDGDCGFCNQSVRFIINHEKSSLYHFTAIQSAFSKSFFDEKNLEYPKDLNTLYLFQNEKLYTKSSAAIRICPNLKFPFNCLVTFIIVPKFIRDFFYDIVAKNRKKLAKNQCFLPTKEQQARFLK